MPAAYQKNVPFPGTSQPPTMRKRCLFPLVLLAGLTAFSQPAGEPIPLVSEISLAGQLPGTVGKYWLQAGSDMFGRPIVVPVLLAKGSLPGPVLGLTAAIHGNELNGIPLIQELFASLDPTQLHGSVVAIPGMNPLGMQNDTRLFLDGEDLNRVFPGKSDGNNSQQMAYALGGKFLPGLDYHLDLHTASFGRINTLYARADLESEPLARMARSLGADIILHSKGEATAGARSDGTLRAMAASMGVHSLTLEMGNPQVYDRDMIARGLQGVRNLLITLGLLEGTPVTLGEALECERSYWVYTDAGGLLEVLPGLGQVLHKGDLIGVLKDPFGKVLARYSAPEDGVVIGLSTNPAAISGSRILHLGILRKAGRP